MVNALATSVSDEFYGSYALLGYSMGAITAFELTRTLVRERLVPPRQLIVVSHPGPHTPASATELHRLEDGDILENLRAFGTIPEQLRSNPEILSVLLPVIRTDLRALETYAYRPGPPVPVPITAIAGLDDITVTEDHMRAWAAETTERFHALRVPGGHFFLHTDPAPMFRVLRAELAPLLAG